MSTILRHGILDFKRTVAVVPEPTYPTDGLVERWGFDDTLTGLNNYSFGVKAGSTEYTTGLRGKCLKYDGTNSHWIENVYNLYSVMQSTTFTISMWIYPEVFAWAKSVFCTAETGKVGIDIFPGSYGSPWNKMLLSLHNSGVWMEGILEPSSGDLPVDTWYHLVFMRTSSTNIRAYINGTEYNRTIPTYGVTSNNIFIGCSGIGTSDRYKGKLDLLYLYNRVLSGSEVSELYNSGAGA